MRAFPTEFRERWQRDMHRTFADRLEHARHVSGRTPRRLIARELMNVATAGVRERLHSSNRPSDMFHLQDIRYAFRLLARSPGFTLLTVVVLAGGLGLSTFTFSFLHTAMIRPLPLGDGDRIVRLMQLEDGRYRQIDLVDVAPLQSSMRSVHHLGAYTRREVIVGREGDRRVLVTTATDPGLFTVARTPAFLGRTLVPADAEAGAAPVIVLSHRTWQIAFGEDRSVIDTHVALNGVSTRVVGVMPKGFGFPVAEDAWLPLPSVRTAAARAGRDYVAVFARLADGVTRDQAAAEASAILQRESAARDTSARTTTRVSAAVESFPEAQIGEGRALVFTAINLLAALILLLALVNVTTLLTARANERVRETAVRLALGASTGRLVMQGMWETIILCVTGGVVGTAAAAWGLSAITRWTTVNLEGNMAFWWVWRMDHVTLISAGAFVTVAIAVLGSVVSLRATKTNVRDVMQDGSARSGMRREGRLARFLVATQVATVTVLMFVGVLSGVMARRVVELDPGYDPTNLLQAAVAPSPDRFATDDARAAVFRNVQARLIEHEAVDNAFLRSRLAEKGSDAGAFAIRDRAATGKLPSANVVATLGAMSTLGIELVEGRMLAETDEKSRAPVVLVSRSLAASQWRQSPVGQQVRLAGVADSLQWWTIVGVVSDIPYGDPFARDRSTDAIYVPLLQTDAQSTSVFVRYRGNEVAGRQALNQVMGAVDPLLVPESVFRASEVIEKSGLMATSLTKLFGSCFAFALLLAVAGTYGLMSRSIGLRTREIGVRRALGATDAMATKLLLRQGAQQVGIGTLVALPILAIVGAVISYYLPLGKALTTTAALLVSTAIMVVVLGATWLPTRKVVGVALRDALWRD
jgi:predicted permease